MSVIFSGLKDLKEEIKEMSEKERETEKPDNIAKMLKRFLSLINNTKKEKE